MSIKGIVKAIFWNLKKCIHFVYELDTIFWMPSRKIDLDKLFAKFDRDEFYFIQIGANDGVTGDDLRQYIEKYKWHGILVEPVPYVFERLKKNYSGFSNLIFEKSAISSRSGFAKFYSISEKDLENNNLFDSYDTFKIDQLSSFDKNTLMKHSYMHPNFEKLISEIEIPVLNIQDLLDKYQVTKLDLLQVDTEGFDFEILKMVDFEKILPFIVIFEHQHLKHREYKILLKKLKKSGYKSYKSNWDTVSIKK
jgi:FkbM family methyltransferase